MAAAASPTSQAARGRLRPAPSSPQRAGRPSNFADAGSAGRGLSPRPASSRPPGRWHDLASLTERQALAIRLLATLGPAIENPDSDRGCFRIAGAGHIFTNATFAALVDRRFARRGMAGRRSAIFITIAGRDAAELLAERRR